MIWSIGATTVDTGATIATRMAFALTVRFKTFTRQEWMSMTLAATGRAKKWTVNDMRLGDFDALKVYVCNVMTQDGETEGYTAAAHVAALMQHGGRGLFDICLTNSARIPDDVAARYALEGAEPIFCAETVCTRTNVEYLCRPVAVVKDGFVRHAAAALAEELMKIYTDRAIRIADDTAGDTYRLERNDR